MRNYKRHTDRGTFPREAMESAVEMVQQGTSLRKAATAHRVNYKTLSRYVKIKLTTGTFDGASFGYPKNKQIFSTDLEELLVNYIIHAARIFHGLTMTDLRCLAYNLATANNLRNIPQKWKDDEMAGMDWAKCFRERHNDRISIRTPEATSIQRMTNFNKHNVDSFFTNLDDALKRGFGPESIWNIDETGVTTVQRPTKVLAEKGARKIGSVVSQERGTLVTVCCGINALGNHIPPFFVFPRVNVQLHWKLSAPPGSEMVGHPKATGWMTNENFIQYLHHFVKHAKPSAQQPILLILDNHQSHVNLDAINYAKDNHISLLSFPPHCSHELQPLDVSVYGPFKTYINQASDSWMRDRKNAGKGMNIHVIPSLVGYAFPKAFSTTNITAGFRATGIWPFDKNIFPPEKFFSAMTTDRPLPVLNNNAGDAEIPTNHIPPVSNHANTSQPSDTPGSHSVQLDTALMKTPTQTRKDLEGNVMRITPEMVRPFGRLSPRKEGTRIVRKKGKSQILTDTPIKAAIEAEKASINAKKMAKKKIIHDSDIESSDDDAEMKCGDKHGIKRKKKAAMGGVTATNKKKIARKTKIHDSNLESSDDDAEITSIKIKGKTKPRIQPKHEMSIQCGTVTTKHPQQQIKETSSKSSKLPPMKPPIPSTSRPSMPRRSLRKQKAGLNNN